MNTLNKLIEEKRKERKTALIFGGSMTFASSTVLSILNYSLLIECWESVLNIISIGAFIVGLSFLMVALGNNPEEEAKEELKERKKKVKKS